MTRMLAEMLGAVLLSASPFAVAQKSGGPVTVQLLAINDFHGTLEPDSGSDGVINGTPAGGAEYLATDLKAAAKGNPNTLIVGAGDLFGASPLLSGLQEDQPAIEAIDAMGLAVSSVGNHEFDHGAAELLRRTKDAKWEYLAANVVEDNGKTLFPAIAVRTMGGVKVGFIGETLKGTDAMIGEKASKGLRFLDESEVANREAARLEGEGVHTIVLLIHQGSFQHRPAREAADPNGCVGFAGDLQPVLDKLSPAIKVVVSAHTHQFYNCTIGGRVVTSASSYGRMFTKINLTIDPATDRLVKAEATNVVVTRDVAKDPAQTAIIEKYKPAADKIRNRVVGAIGGDITKSKSAAGETAIGDVIADAQLAATSAKPNGGAMIALMNSGGIRADLVAGAGGTSPHEVTFGDLYAVQPFGNRLTVFTLTGEQLRRVLEQQFNGNGEPQLLQISTGFAYSYKLHTAPGEHIVAMTLNGRPIAPTDELRVEATDFVAQGAEGLTALRERTDSVAGGIDLDALIAYFGARSPVAPGPRNRITRVD